MRALPLGVYLGAPDVRKLTFRKIALHIRVLRP